MKEIALTSAVLHGIEVPERLRALDEAWVEALAVSIGEQGLHQPIVVKMGAGAGGQYVLLAGAHRLAACRKLGLERIPARVVQANRLESRLIEIDENLIRRELNPLDRAAFLAERKAVWETLHPETKNGAQGGRGGKRNENESFSFSKATAEKIGLSRRTIELAVRIQARLAPKVRKRLADTFLSEKQGELLALARLDPALQAKVLDLVLAASTPGTQPPRGVAAAVKHLSGAPARSDEDRQLQRLLDAWNRAGAKTRAAFIGHLRDAGALPGATT